MLNSINHFLRLLFISKAQSEDIFLELISYESKKIKDIL